MANLKVFLSSTCYDLAVVRSQLRNFLINLGYDAILSDYSDVLFDPRIHTHTSCVQEVPNCDMVILIIGSRFGGEAIPEAFKSIEIDKLQDESKGTNFLESEKFSVTQLEVLRAIQSRVPIFTFVESGVFHDHLTYEKNKHSGILNNLIFPRIDKQETATYIFEFINFLRHRVENNSLIEFSKLEDIESHLRKQWSGLFQKLLYEQRNKKIETQRIDYIANQIADIKTAIVTSITNSELKETAKGAIKFRMMIEFIYSLSKESGNSHPYEVLMSNDNWNTILSNFEILDIFSEGNNSITSRVILIRSDLTYFRTRLHLETIRKLEIYWEQFKEMSSEVRKAIINAVIDNSDIRMVVGVKYVNERYENPSSTNIDFTDSRPSDDDIPF